MRSSDDRILTINTVPVVGDPLADAIKKGTRLGLLGIELTTRRRNRLAAHVTEHSENGFQLHVDQAFGNCPQYIQTRELDMLDPTLLPTPSIEHIHTFDEQAKALIANSDTFFVASYVDNHDPDNTLASEGADVSHRGGKPGFIRVDNDKTLTIPDYSGNFHFNTFGNFIENSKAGLLFVDFENGHLLTLTGTVEILWDSPETKYFEGAERLWTFRIDHGRWIRHGLPLRWKLDQFSPSTLQTDTWEAAKNRQQANTHKREEHKSEEHKSEEHKSEEHKSEEHKSEEHKSEEHKSEEHKSEEHKSEEAKSKWLPYSVTKMIKESSVITSFYLEAQDHQQPTFKPGQFLTVKADIKGQKQIRTYTLSSAPTDSHYRISVKRETSTDNNVPDGIFSNYLHDNLNVGDTLYAKAPCGDFTFDTTEKRPAVLLAGGVGITPMVSMVRHALKEGMRTHFTRDITFIGAAKNKEQRSFFEELNTISESSGGKIRAFWSLGKIDKHLKHGEDFHHHGRISKALLQAILPLDDYDVYLCGPTGFMQATYALLRGLGISDARIYAEEFGPASLKRNADNATRLFKPLPAATEAIIEFTDSNVEQAWSKEDGSLLDFAEAHGLTPEFGCRSGQCGACKTKLVSGKVAYQTEHTSSINDDEVLLCCAVPAALENAGINESVHDEVNNSTDKGTARLRIKL
ncbi:FAD-binding oxidoreductase [Photobacterium frigidiphilum]|uniref:FAD-binding oxidoreductase n=2 Tax=Photobacterium frigidiphilum TaxID=264736 RepID=A0A2T3J9N7_9GAMM|nr:FAD-binding oxidoreductase [Photobacterium frigidiphilum]